MRWCRVNFQCRGVLLIWLIGKGPLRLQQMRVGVVWTFFLSSIISLLFLPLSGRRLDIDRKTVSNGRLTQINQPTHCDAVANPRLCVARVLMPNTHIESNVLIETHMSQIKRKWRNNLCWLRTEPRKGHFFSNIYQKRNRNKKN